MRLSQQSLALLLTGAGVGCALAQGPGDTIPELIGKWFPSYCIPDGATCPFDVAALALTPRPSSSASPRGQLSIRRPRIV
jgi:hypothetical protein